MVKYLKIVKTIVLICGFCFITGCSSSPGKVSMSQLESDIPYEMKEITIDSDKRMPLQIESIEVAKRLTEDIYDEIHCNVVMNNDEYRVNGVYVCEYKHYDQGGWSLENCWLEDVTIVCIADIPSEVKGDMERQNERIWIDDEVFDVINVESKHIGDNCYELWYDVELANDYDYLDIKGIYRQRYSLVSYGGLSCAWEEEEDSSGVVTTWDIVGTYIGKTSKESCEVIIDSYNQETKEAHIASYKYERKNSWTLPDAKYNLSDFTVTGEIIPSGSFMFSFYVDEGEYHRLDFNEYNASAEFINLEKQ